MSAIYGMVGTGHPDALRMMGERLQHRGRSRGEWMGDHAMVGQAVHGATAPAPLMADGVVVVADATFYNADELREMLRARGRCAETQRPEELILQGYLEFGPSICQYFNGDFAFAVWDARQSLLLLARDPFGCRPLFFWREQGRCVFASEYKAILAIPHVPVVPDRDAIQQLQSAKHPPENRTLLRGILSVPAGHWMAVSTQGCQTSRYWDMSIDVVRDSVPRVAHAVREAFLASVRRRLADRTGEVGATLSGGIDSAAVVAAIRQVRPDLTLHTFTCGYGGDDPEMATAATVAQALDTQHHPLVVHPEQVRGMLPRVVWHLEDPVARSETVLTFAIASRVAEKVDVALGGYGSDGLYAGMPKHKILKLAQWFPWLREPLGEFYHYTQVSQLPRSLAGKALLAAYYRGKDTPPPRVCGAATPAPAEPLPSERRELINHMLRSGVLGGVRVVHKADRLHAAHGVSFRSPFLDVHLARQAFTIPDRCKIRGWTEKYIFREAVRPLLPNGVLNRPKLPQTMRVDRTFSNTLDGFADEVLSPSSIRSRGFFTVTDIERLRRRTRRTAYGSEQAMRLWTAIATELWAQFFLDRRGEPLSADARPTPSLAHR